VISDGIRSKSDMYNRERGGGGTGGGGRGGGGLV